MSNWTHLICEECWHELRGTMTPTRLVKAPLHPCCYCGKPTRSGIYTRDDPTLTKCGGKGVVHKDD